MTDAPATRRIALAILQVVVTIALIAWLVHLFGTSAVSEAGAVLTPLAVAGAIALGLVGGLAQGLRWQAVAAGLGDRMSTAYAVARCLEAAFLNAILPGGLAGDAVRAFRRGRSGTRWTASIGSVVGERLCGTAVVLLAATAAAVSWGRLDLAAAFALITVAVAAVAGWSMRRLPARSVLACVGWSVLGWLCFLGLFALAARELAAAHAAPALAPGTMLALGSLTLAGMSVPINVGGWGPREGAATLAYGLAGLDPATGFTTSVAYGLLALISTLPGALVTVAGLLRSLRRDEHAEDDGTR